MEYVIKDTVEGGIVFRGSMDLFIAFVKSIVKDNRTEDYSILGVSDAVVYIDDYCNNLEVTS